MATITWFVDTGNTTGPWDGTSLATAYQHLNDFNTNEVTNLVTDGNSYIVECYATTGIADDAVCIFGTSWITGISNTLTIKAGNGNEALKTGWSTSRYRLQPVLKGLGINVDYVNIENLQISYILDVVPQYALNIYTLNTSNNVVVEGCRIDGSNLNGVAFQIHDDYANVTINKCIVENSGYEGIKFTSTCTNANIEINNCDIANVGTGIWNQASGNTVIVTNCISANVNDDFAGTMTIDHCASIDGDGTNPISPSGGDWDNELADPDNGDFTLLLGGNCYHGGNDTSVQYDIEGEPYHISTPSIGVDEIIVINAINDVALFNVGNQLYAPSLEIGNEINVGVLNLGILLYNIIVDLEVYHSDSFGNSDITKSKLPGKPEITNGKMVGKPEILGK